MDHVADRILAELKTRLAVVPGILGAYVTPLHLLDVDQLPAIIVTDIEDTVIASVGHFPIDQTRELKFVVQICQIATASTFAAQLSPLHADVCLALFGSVPAISLGGLLTRGLKEEGAALFTDTESLQQPVGGWRISVTCTYNHRSDQPGKTEKE